MGMGIGINQSLPDEGVITGKQESVACSVWFTSNGKIMPKMIKYQELDGEVVTIYPIHVITSAKKNYCGIPTIEFQCESTVGRYSTRFRLYYYIEKQEWKVIWQY